MSFSDAEEVRVRAIEEMINTLQIAINNLASKEQMRQLLLIKQSEIDSLTSRIASLEAQLTALQGSID